jgi:peptidoglycan/LPS O-acetylase OafA/YrhL
MRLERHAIEGKACDLGGGMPTFQPRRSFGEVLDRQNGMSAGFDVLRWGLALLIFYGHCKWLAGSGVISVPSEAVGSLADRGWSGWRRPLQVSLVPMFFALSGFLVTASALRVREVSSFLTLRALRIFPALAVEVTLSALLLGPLLTALILSDYFSGWAFWRYFGNIFGLVAYDLPGVFDANKTTNIVNANLWTLPAEFYCYLVSAALLATGQMLDRASFTRVFAVVTVLAVGSSLAFGFGQTPTTASTPLLVYYFFAGCLYYHWRGEIPRDLRLLAIAGIASYALLYWRATAFLAPLAVVYVTIYIGLLHHDRIAGLRKFDYSYGIYLYGFPITQAVLAIAPTFHGQGKSLALVAGLITLAFAALSWHLIEQPTLALKKRFISRPAPVLPEAGHSRQPSPTPVARLDVAQST